MTDCLFCKIARGEIPATTVAESDQCMAFRDIAPQAPVHVLVIPKTHYTSVNDITDWSELAEVMAMGREVARAEGIDSKGYRLVINTGKDGGQTVDHLHLHVMGGRHMTWPPG